MDTAALLELAYQERCVCFWLLQASTFSSDQYDYHSLALSSGHQKRIKNGRRLLKVFHQVIDLRLVVIKITRCCLGWMRKLSSKSVQSPALPLEGIDDIKCCHCLTTSMLSVGNCIPDHVLKEHLENASGLLIDQARNTLHTSTTSQPPDCWLGDSLDVVSEHLPVSLGSSLSCISTWHVRSRHLVCTLETLIWVYAI